MNALHAFLHPEYREITREVVISNRFKDEEGKVVPFKVKTITQEMNKLLTKKCTEVGKNGQSNLNMKKYNNVLIVECCVVPDFKSAELCAAYGTNSPEEVPERLLIAGEYGRLMEAILETNQFKSGNELEDEAKNS